MPQYIYTARSRKGEKTTGVVEAQDRRRALAQIERMGYVPVSVSEGARPAAPAPKKRERPHFVWRRGRQPRMKLREVLVLTRELSDLVASGMKLGNALNTLAGRETGRDQDRIVTELRDDIIQGSSLSDALARWPKSFSPLYVSMVRAGEASGALPEALERLCEHYERVQAAREKVLMALIYPAIVLVAGGATLILSMVFVIPRFSKIFEDLGSTMPLPTLMLIKSSAFLVQYGWILLGLALFGGFLFRRALRTREGRRRWHALQLRLPLVRQVLTANAYAQFARTLGSLLENGVPVLQALSIVENTIGNMVIADEIHAARNRVTDGASISEPLAAGGCFPRLLTDMLAVGEESGDMSGALKHIAKRYEDELDRSVKILTSLLEPILMLLMAVLIGFVAISMLLAVFDLTSGLSL